MRNAAAAAAIWLTWKNSKLKLVMSCYICVKRGGGSGGGLRVYESSSLQACKCRQVWCCNLPGHEPRLSIRHVERLTTTPAPASPDLCHWTTSHHPRPLPTSWNRPRLPRAAIRIYRVFCVALPSCDSVYKTWFCSVMCGACIRLGFYMAVCVSFIKITP